MFEDDNLEFAENGRKFSDRVENTVGKGEIAHFKQFLFFGQCFEKTCTADMLKQGLVWERLSKNREVSHKMLKFLHNDDGPAEAMATSVSR